MIWESFHVGLLQIVNRVQVLEKSVIQLQQEVDRCHANRVSCCCCAGRLCAQRRFSLEQCSKQYTFPVSSSDCSPRKCENNAKNGDTLFDDAQQSSAENSLLHVVARPSSEKFACGASDTVKVESAEPALPNSDIHRNATVKLVRAVQTRISEDPEKRRLIAAYDQLNELITMNETAVDDALSYVKAIKEVDEIGAKEYHSQIMKLVVSINQEKEKRTVALVDLIVYVWTRRQEELVSLLQNDPLAAERNKAEHKRSVAIASQIEEKESELETLETQLNDQLLVVDALSSSTSGLDRGLQLEVLWKLSERLTKEQAAKELLERERENVWTCFLQGDDEIRKLVRKSL